MLIDAIREDGVEEVVNSEHVARAWEEPNPRFDTLYKDIDNEPEKITIVMFSCGLLVRYKWWTIERADG